MAYLEDYRRTIYLDKLGGVDPHLVYETIDILGVGKTVLSQGADLNTIIDSGIYSSDSNIGGTLINSPSTGIQVMIAYRATASYLVQVIFSYSSNNAHFRIAYNANGTPVFTDWHQL